MDKLEQYRQFVQQILSSHAEIATTTDTVKAELIFELLLDIIACSWRPKPA